MTRAGALAGLSLIACGLAGGAAADSIHLYSYDPADAETRHAAGPLTFTFKKGLLRNTVLNIRSTEAPATAELRHADEAVLGKGGLTRLIGPAATERDLYEVEPGEEGAALISAFCPGSQRAWMAVGLLKMNRDLTVRVIGAPAAAGPAKVCRTFQFSFHGEWRTPPDHVINPKEFVEPSRLPGV